MEASKEVQMILKCLEESRPMRFLTLLDNPNVGASCVLRYLAEADHPVSAGEISSFMNVSTARTAVLLRKLSERNMIVKESDPSDARKTLIRISEYGKEYFVECEQAFLARISYVIGKVGVERMKTFIEIANEIKDAMPKDIAEYKDKE